MSDALTEKIIGAAIEVHRILGPGLLESIYEEALCHELCLRGVVVERQVDVNVIYKDKVIKGQKLDILVEDEVVIELQAVAKLPDVAMAQALSYLKSNGPEASLIDQLRRETFGGRNQKNLNVSAVPTVKFLFLPQWTPSKRSNACVVRPSGFSVNRRIGILEYYKFRAFSPAELEEITERARKNSKSLRLNLRNARMRRFNSRRLISNRLSLPAKALSSS